jgi:ribosomal protein S18 acetylase RimI-like enzyme
MQFELTDALIDDILFSMENHESEFLLDTQKGMVVCPENDEFYDEEEAEKDEGRYINLPDWDSSEGFRLMEHFTAGLRSPIAREELSAALNRGRGVFRAFKDALERYPEIEKRWFNFKEREMKREVIRWYNALRESWGLERIGSEPEETDDLVLEDFTFRESSAGDAEAAAALHRLCSATAVATAAELASANITASAEENAAPSAHTASWIFPGDLSFVAETASGEFSGCVSAKSGENSSLYIRVLEVSPRYRGLGLGRALLERFLAEADRRGIRRIFIDLPVEAENFSRALLRESFKPRLQCYCREAPHNTLK